MNKSEQLDIIHKDIQKRIFEWYLREKIRTKKSEKPEETIVKFIAFLQGRIPVKPRDVYYSVELKEKISKESNENPQFKHVKDFEQAFVEGQNMNQYLSKRANDPNFPDYLRYAWGIYHLHLEEIQENKSKPGTAKQRTPLLMCIIDETSVCFVDTVSHPKTAADFMNIDLLKVIKNNGWMSRIGFGENLNFTVVEKIETNEDLFDLYKNGINVPFQFDGTCYVGFSLMSSRAPYSAVRSFCNMNKLIMKNILDDKLEYVGFEFSCDDGGETSWVIIMKNETEYIRYTVYKT